MTDLKLESSPISKLLLSSKFGKINVQDPGDLAKEIHADNVRAGWWTDRSTGESTLESRNRPEMLMLAVSEIAEAALGVEGCMDDKLPHLPMYDVELADFVIRQLDQIGAELRCGHEAPNWAFLATWETDLFSAMPHLGDLRAMSRSDRLMELVKSVAAAMEHYRRGRIPNYMRTMAEGVLLAFAIAEIERIDLFDIITQKRVFNRNRPDHKPENRAKEGGKAF